MTTLIIKKNISAVFIAIALLMLSNDVVLAKRDPGKQSGAGRISSKTNSSVKSPSARGTQRSSSVRRTTKSVSSPRLSTKSNSPKSYSAPAARRSNSMSIRKSTVSQRSRSLPSQGLSSSRTPSVKASPRVSNVRSFSVRSRPTITTSPRKNRITTNNSVGLSAKKSIAIRRTVIDSSSIGTSISKSKNTTLPKRLTSTRTSRIGGTIGSNKSRAPSSKPESTAGKISSISIQKNVRKAANPVAKSKPTEKTSQKPLTPVSPSRSANTLRSITGRFIGEQKASNLRGGRRTVVKSVDRREKFKDLRFGSSVNTTTKSSVNLNIAGENRPRNGAMKKAGNDRTGLLRKSRVIGPSNEKRLVSAKNRITGSLNVERGKTSRSVPKNNSIGEVRTSRFTGKLNGGRTGSRVFYHDRPREVRHRNRYEHVYRDYHHKLCRRAVWPKYRYMVRYDYGPYFHFQYVYPYYHRKYIFISLGGWWPLNYSYARYYWYGCHPWRWYGYYPLATEVQGSTYNYYTYNYYDGQLSGSGEYVNGIVSADENTFADVREKLAQQSAEQPQERTLADTYFENGVKAFENGDWASASDYFAKSMDLADEDIILPFAYSQALFAGERYTDAASVLKAALEKVEPEKEGVFYPRGLYSDEEKLFEQIGQLAEQVELYSFRSELQLLLGYQLLGVEQTELAKEHLRKAGENPEYAAVSELLIGLVEKNRAEQVEINSQ